MQRTEQSSLNIHAIDTQYVQKGEGSVIIPSLEIRENIYRQSDKFALNKGSELLNTSGDYKSFGNGNLVLAAHNYNDNMHGFSRLQQNANHDEPYLVNSVLGTNDWLNGQKILIVNKKNIFVYNIDGQRAVKATDTRVLFQTPNKELNLITCLFPSDNYRIVTHAQQINSYTWSDVPQAIKYQILGR